MDDKNNPTTDPTNPNPTNEPKKVTFDEAQQHHLDTVVIPARLKRERETLTRELTDSLTTELTAKLTSEITAKLAAENGRQTDSELMRERALTKAALEGQKAESEKSKALAAEIASIRKRAAMDAAMGDLFVNRDVIAMMTDNPAQGVSIELDKDTGQYVVREKGSIRMTPSLEPMTLNEYYAEFAGKNDYLAVGKTKAGTGASGSATNAPLTQQVLAKADLKNNAAKIAFIKANGYAKFAALPLKRPA